MNMGRQQRKTSPEDFVVESGFTSMLLYYTLNVLQHRLHLNMSTVYLYLELYPMMLHFLNRPVLVNGQQ